MIEIDLESFFLYNSESNCIVIIQNVGKHSI